MTNKETIYRQDVLDLAKKGVLISNGNYESVCKAINELSSVNPQPCEDAIDRAEAIKIASGYCHPANVAKELAKLPSVNPTKTGWIPVNERMPENRKEVLVTDGTDIFTGWYEGDKWCSCYEEFWPYSDPIIAWMPLPKRYESQERSDKE